MKLIAATIAAMAFASPALANNTPDCMSIPAMLEFYSNEYDETPRWSGISGKDDGDIIILTADDGSWSLFRTNGDIACLVDFGLSNKSLSLGNV